MHPYSNNWPGGVNRAGSNWSGRTQRTDDWGGAWAKDSYDIPWHEALPFLIVGAIVFVIFAIVGAVCF